MRWTGTARPFATAAAAAGLPGRAKILRGCWRRRAQRARSGGRGPSKDVTSTTSGTTTVTAGAAPAAPGRADPARCGKAGAGAAARACTSSRCRTAAPAPPRTDGATPRLPPMAPGAAGARGTAAGALAGAAAASTGGGGAAAAAAPMREKLLGRSAGRRPPACPSRESIGLVYTTQTAAGQRRLLAAPTHTLCRKWTGWGVHVSPPRTPAATPAHMSGNVERERAWQHCTSCSVPAGGARLRSCKGGGAPAAPARP